MGNILKSLRENLESKGIIASIANDSASAIPKNINGNPEDSFEKRDSTSYDSFIKADKTIAYVTVPNEAR